MCYCIYQLVVQGPQGRHVWSRAPSGPPRTQVPQRSVCRYSAPPATPPILSTFQGAKILNSVQGHVVPQNSRQARSLLDADKRMTDKHEEMRSIADKKVIAWTSSFLPNGVVAINTKFVYALKWTLETPLKSTRPERWFMDFWKFQMSIMTHCQCVNLWHRTLRYKFYFLSL